MVSGAAAYAADLGGNCCADLEERVAELEATTARKGNRKVSLTISGHINEAVLFWDDGVESNAYVVSNNAARSRFRFVGDAKINADWSAGYLLEIGARYANSGSRNQGGDKAGQGNDSTRPLDIRHSAWWIDSKQLGRMWVGKTTTATDGITEIQLANINSGGSSESYAGGFGLRRTSDNGYLGTANTVLGTINPTITHTWNQVTPSFAGAWWAGEGDRNTTVKYVSPTLAGFIFSAAWGQDDIWDVALRYAGEFGGFRLAAGVGYMQQSDNLGGKASADGPICSDLSGWASQSAVDCHKLGLSASLMHIGTGLFIGGSYGYIQDNNRNKLFTSGTLSTGTGGGNTSKLITAGSKNRDDHWQINGGIEQKWTSLGKTTLFGDYMETTTGASLCGTGGPSAGACITQAVDGLADSFISSAKTKVWGIGINQEIAAAAMDMYVTYRHHSVDANLTNFSGTLTTAASIKDFDMVIAGAIIRF